MKQFNLETQVWEGEDDPPLTSLKYLQSVYRDENRPENMRIRCAIEALPYENPKLSATAIATMDGQSFAQALERCIERSRGPVLLNSPVLNGQVVEEPKSYRRIVGRSSPQSYRRY